MANTEKELEKALEERMNESGAPDRSGTGIPDLINEPSLEGVPTERRGRPKKEKRLQDGYKISVAFPEEWKEKIKDAADNYPTSHGKGITIADFIRNCVYEKINIK